jgi:hypothetical protein
MHLTKILAAGLTIGVIASPAAAAVNLTGATASAVLLYPDTSTVYANGGTQTVGAGVEFGPGSFAPAAGSIDVASRTITFFTNQVATYGPGAFNGYRIDLSGYAGSLGRAVLDASSTYTPTSVYVSGNSVYIDLIGTSANGGFAQINLGVPEPANWALMIAGFGLAGAAMRVRRRKVSFA